MALIPRIHQPNQGEENEEGAEHVNVDEGTNDMELEWSIYRLPVLKSLNTASIHTTFTSILVQC